METSDTFLVELLRFIRRRPRTSQQCRDWSPLASVRTEMALRYLRDEGEIAYANGAWYVPTAGRLTTKRKPRDPDPRQGKLFHDDD